VSRQLMRPGPAPATQVPRTKVAKWYLDEVPELEEEDQPWGRRRS
jgi:hypothetical protein